MSIRTIALLLSLLLTACNDEDKGAESRPEPVTPIEQVQGSGDVSPLDGDNVVVSGIVTGDFQDNDADDQGNLGGFFLQSETGDGNPETSDGIFVFDGRTPVLDVEVGQKLMVSGLVAERFGETQIAATAVTLTGSGEISATSLVLPVATRMNADGQLIADLERFEGMLVRLAAETTVTETYFLERFGELSLSQGGRLWQFTNRFSPDVAGFADHQRENAARTIILDDGMSIQNPAALRYLAAPGPEVNGNALRIGDVVVEAVGNIRFSRGSGAAGTEAFRLEPVTDPIFRSGNLRPFVPPATHGSVTVASFNVLNYFTTIDTGGDHCGPQSTAGCRGADSIEELERQQEKTIRTLLALNADIVGLMELENNGGVSLRSIVDGLNARAGAGQWDAIDTGVVGADAITVGLIYRTAAVRPASRFAVLTSAVDSRFNDQKNRPGVAQAFDALPGGGRFTVAVNHFKSKGSDCNDVGDPNRHDGQGECSVTRTRAATALGDWLNSDPTGSGNNDVLIIGDLNAYLQEDPVTVLEEAGFTSLLKSMVGNDAYSLVFDGQAGALDHAFASRSMLAKVAGVAEWHINADESPLFDYNLDFDRDASWFDASTPFRTSDHDPLIVGINP